MKVNISGLDKAEVLLGLYNAAGYNDAALMFPGVPTSMGKLDIAQRFISMGKLDVDYVNLGQGPKAIKVDLSGSEFDPSLYDCDHGEGSAERVVASLRSALSVSRK